MKHIFIFILLSLYLSTIITQIVPNLTGDWIPGWLTITFGCCIPSEITIVQNSTTNNYQAAFTFPSNYTFSYCYIKGNFTAELSFNGYESDSEGLLITENYYWEDSVRYINITQSSISSSIFSPLGPFFEVISGLCSYFIVPAGTSNPYQEMSSNNFIYSSNMSAQGFNATSNKTIDSCCMPNSFSITELTFYVGNGYSAYFVSEITYSEESLRNIWCTGGYAFNTTIPYISNHYNGNISFWEGTDNPFYRIIMDNNSPGFVQAIYTGYFYSDSICTFNMTLSQTPTPNSGPSNILQPNMTGSWITGWQTDSSSCCVPSQITINQNSSTNNYQVGFSFPSNYTSNNSYCNKNNIKGSFMDDFSFGAYMPNSAEVVLSSELNFYIDSESSTGIMSITMFSSINDLVLGPFYEVSIGNGECGYSISERRFGTKNA